MLYNIIKECKFKTARSGGAGGQHVNKVETKVIIIFDIEASIVLSIEQKELLQEKLKNKINKQNELILSAQNFKSQLKNKKLVEEKLLILIEKALKVNKKRKKSKISKKVKEKRLKNKKIISEIKRNRKKIRFRKD